MFCRCIDDADEVLASSRNHFHVFLIETLGVLKPLVKWAQTKRGHGIITHMRVYGKAHIDQFVMLNPFFDCFKSHFYSKKHPK